MATKWLCGLLPPRSSPSSSSSAPKEKLRWSFLKCYRRKKDRPSRIRRDKFSGHHEAAVPADQGAAAVFRQDSGTANPAAADVSGRGARIREESAAVKIRSLEDPSTVESEIKLDMVVEELPVLDLTAVPVDNEKNLSFYEEVPVERSKGNDGKVLEEHSLEILPGSGVDKSIETEFANGPLLTQNGEHLPGGLSQETFSESLVFTEQDVSSENAKSLTSPSVCGDIALESGQSMPAVPVNDIIGSQDVEDIKPEIDSGDLTQESMKNPDDSCPALMNGPELSCAYHPANGVMSAPKSCSSSKAGEERVSTDAIDVESVIPNMGLEYGVNQHVSNASIQLESEDDDGIMPKDSDSGIVVDGDLDFEHIGSDVKSACQEAEGMAGKKKQMEEVSSFPQENLGQNVDIDGNQKDEVAAPTTLSENKLEGQNAGVEVVKRPFYYLIRIERYDDENLREQIKRVELQVEERTKIQDAIVAEVHVQADIVEDFASKVQASFTGVRAARELFKSKRQEIDSVQFLINKVKSARLVEDIQEKICSREYIIEHETLPLKEEKQLIRDIKQLKELREQLSSNMGKHDEVQQALDQKDQIEERLKVLSKELDLLREKVTKAEEVRQTAREKSDVENDKLKELLSQLRDADNIRHEAYVQLWSLKKQRYEKNNHFYGYRDAFEAAQKLALSGDKEQLQRFCIDQVEKVMELWNRNDDFRQDYIRSNTRSTLRRLSTLDGRSLGPDEERPVIPDVVNNRATKDNSVSLTNVPEQEKQEVPAKADKLDDKSGTKVVERSKQPAKTKKPAKLASSSSTKLDTTSGEDERKQEVREVQEEELIMYKAEEELARKAEELRREEEAVKLKQQRKLEEGAKAKEAIERKKRIAEKAQARAAIRAQKEAEKEEKVREKRAREKEKKKANGIENRNGDEVGLRIPTPSSEIPGNGAQPESEKLATIMKRQQKAQQFTKQGRARFVAVPPPFRNRGKRTRGKRRMQPWMWVALVVAIVLASSLCWPLLAMICF